MNLEIIVEQLTLLVGVFLLVNSLFFMSSQYSIHFQTDICNNVSGGDFSVQNQLRTSEYYRDSCNSIFEGWKTVNKPPIKLRYHIIPLISALLITGIFTYYRVLESEFHGKGVQNWNERRP